MKYNWETTNSRRRFLQQVAQVGALGPVASILRANRCQASPNERINIGVIGASGWGAVNVAAVGSENIVAICDVDLTHINQAKQAFPEAAVYQDFRKLLDHRGLQAVVLSTPDHMHAVPAVLAMRMGLPVYCEHPLAHSVYEARVMHQTAASTKVVTQMGVQAHSRTCFRQCLEILRRGYLGKVSQVFVWSNAKPKQCSPGQREMVPATLDYNLWLGPAPYRPYDVAHCHQLWKYWWDFGGGTLAELGCAYLDLPFCALGLQSPDAVQAEGLKLPGPNGVPESLRVQYEFPGSGNGPLRLEWYHGDWKPPVPEFADHAHGILFLGDKGSLFTNLRSFQIRPEEQSVEWTRDLGDWETEGTGHHQEWLDAIRANRPASCDFGYAGALTEAVLLGNIAYRSGNKKLYWDARALRFRDDLSNASSLVRRDYREGWSL